MQNYLTETKVNLMSDISLEKSLNEYIHSKIGLLSDDIMIIKTNAPNNWFTKIQKNFKTVLSISSLNNFERIDKLFEFVNFKLEECGRFVGFIDTHFRRNYLFEIVLPANFETFMKQLKKIVFPHILIPIIAETKERKQKLSNISKAEIYGRLYSCGFKIVNESEVLSKTVFEAIKVNEPNEVKCDSGKFIIKLERIGAEGKLIKVYKLRTMYPYSQFIQDYVYEKNGMINGDKALNDFRITRLGRFLRKYWIDEIPMLYNWIMGDIKLVGVRPLSLSKFKMYPEWLQQKRIKYKPGLLPPFYADNPGSLEGLIESENKYLDQFDRSPYLTDIIYFFRITFSIIFKKARSR